MIDFFMGIVFSFSIVGVFMMIHEAVDKKSKAQGIASKWYYICNFLWCKGSKYDPIRFYVGLNVDLWIERLHTRSSNREFIMYKVHINNKECATVIKIDDGVTSFFSFYVEDKYEEEEIFELLDRARTVLEAHKVQDSRKISVLKD